MQLRKVIEETGAFRYMTDLLDIQSGAARRMLYETPFLYTESEINTGLDNIEQTIRFICAYVETVGSIRIKLKQLKDIRGTLARLEKKHTLDDIELFEVKSLALLSSETLALLSDKQLTFVQLPDLNAVIGLLDPENNRVPHFYIYDAYSPELAIVRKKIKQLSQAPETGEALEQLYRENESLENDIRQTLSEQLAVHVPDISNALTGIAMLDIVLAKAQQAIDLKLNRPVVAGTTAYKGLFNPQVQHFLEANAKNFQAVDIDVRPEATLITGANMGGKTVLLKTVALAQYLFQFGCYVPAQSAEIALVDEVLLSAGDEQNECNGLSSFAAEMLKIDAIIAQAKAGKKLLVLIDEPARTTNPQEGVAIVNALVHLLSVNNVRALITTHYSGIKASCRRLRVKGLSGKTIGGNINVETINSLMDYSPEETGEEAVPCEAIRIASLLGVDADLIDKATEFLTLEPVQPLSAGEDSGDED
jgi:DNA mismatch repair ATPase MutS